MRSVVAASVLVLLVSLARAQQFTYDPTALPAQSIWSNGVVLVDVDGDDDLDIAFANGSIYGGTSSLGSQPQHLFLNDGTGTFTAAHAQLGVPDFDAMMVIADDLDGDGDPDLMYASGSTDSPPRLLLNDGAGSFTDVTATHVPALPLRSFGLAAGDTDADGDLDVVVLDGGTFEGLPARARLLANDGAAVFTDVSALRMPADLVTAQDVTLLDVDADLDIDMLFVGKADVSPFGRMYLNDGTGNFSVSHAFDGVGTFATYEAEYGDLDGDGDFDAAVQSIEAPLNEGWARNDGPTVPWPKTTFTGNVSQDDNEIACFDYDDDGDFDVLVGSLGSSERVFANDGAANFAIANGVFQAIADGTLDLALGDLDGDGRYDVVTAEGENGDYTDKVYFNSGAADTRAPVFVSVETPSALGADSTPFRCQLRDQISDDGRIGVELAYSYTADGAPGGGGAAFHLGGGLYRAVVPTARATAVHLTWSATDGAGNTSIFGPVTVGGTPDPWADLGRGLAGVAGEPLLDGNGPLLAGSAGSLDLTQAAPSAACVLFVSLSSSPVPFKGGSLCAFPISALVPLTTDGSGARSLMWGAWPPGLSGVSLYFQCGVNDLAAINGVSLSNALQGDVP